MSERAPDYAQGFKDGFAAGLEEGKKLAPKQTRLDDYVFGNTYLGSLDNMSYSAGSVNSTNQYDDRGWRIK